MNSCAPIIRDTSFTILRVVRELLHVWFDVDGGHERGRDVLQNREGVQQASLDGRQWRRSGCYQSTPQDIDWHARAASQEGSAGTDVTRAVDVVVVWGHHSDPVYDTEIQYRYVYVLALEEPIRPVI